MSLMSPHPLDGLLYLGMTAANTWSSIQLCHVLVLGPGQPVTTRNFFSSFTFCSSPTVKGCGCYLCGLIPLAKSFPPFPVPFPNLSGLIGANPSGRCCGAGLCLAEFVPDGGPRCSKIQTKSIVTTSQIYSQDNGHHQCWGYCSKVLQSQHPEMGRAELMWAQQRRFSKPGTQVHLISFME